MIAECVSAMLKTQSDIDPPGLTIVYTAPKTLSNIELSIDAVLKNAHKYGAPNFSDQIRRVSEFHEYLFEHR
jgi:hypothetical protein